MRIDIRALARNPRVQLVVGAVFILIMVGVGFFFATTQSTRSVTTLSPTPVVVSPVAQPQVQPTSQPPPAVVATPFATRTFTFALFRGECTQGTIVPWETTMYAKVKAGFVLSGVGNFKYLKDHGRRNEVKLTGKTEKGKTAVQPDEPNPNLEAEFCETNYVGNFPTYVRR